MRLGVVEVAEVTKTDEGEKKKLLKIGETCGEGSICPWIQASQSSPGGEQALACRWGWTPTKTKHLISDLYLVLGEKYHSSLLSYYILV